MVPFTQPTHFEHNTNNEQMAQIASLAMIFLKPMIWLETTVCKTLTLLVHAWQPWSTQTRCIPSIWKVFNKSTINLISNFRFNIRTQRCWRMERSTRQRCCTMKRQTGQRCPRMEIQTEVLSVGVRDWQRRSRRNSLKFCKVMWVEYGILYTSLL